MENRKVLADRLKQALEDHSLTQAAASERLSVPLSTLKSWLAGRFEPKSNDLLKIARLTGRSMEWLLTGEEAPMPAVLQSGETSQGNAIPPATGWPETDGRFLGRIAERISKVYQEVGAHIGLAQLTELAARHHDSIIALADDDEQREQLLVMALTKLRRELTSGTPSSKRRA